MRSSFIDVKNKQGSGRRPRGIQAANFKYSLYIRSKLHALLEVLQLRSKGIFCLNGNHLGDLPGSPVVRTPCFHCRQNGFDPWSGN